MMLYILFWILGYVYSNKCYNKSSNGVTGSWFCCNNHEDRNGICTECAIGYISKDGLRCRPCLYGRYGNKCGHICRCQQTERCDIVQGCIEGTTVIPGSLDNGKCYNNASNEGPNSWYCCNNHVENNGICVECKTGYVSKDGFSCLPCVDGKWGRKCGFNCQCKDHEKCDPMLGCVDRKMFMSESWERTKPTEMTTPKRVQKAQTKDGLLLIVYVVGTGSIAALVTLASCCFKYKRKLDQSYNSRSQIMHVNKAATEWKDVCRKNERDKYSLNEGNMIDTSTLIRTAKNNEHGNGVEVPYSASVDEDWVSNSFSFSDEEVNKPANEGFLDLFQSMIAVDIHHTLPEDTPQNFEKISSGQSGSIKHSAVPIYGNIQPYIPMIPYCDENEYSC